MKFSVAVLFLFSLLLVSVSPDGEYDRQEQPQEEYSSPEYNAATLPSWFPFDHDNLLSSDYYRQTCPMLEEIIHKKVLEWVAKDPTLAASLIRLHFHDCAATGCDASILLNHEGSERKAEASKTLRGFQVIDDIKAELERVCPKTVSCADILTAASRDATVSLGGPYWTVPYGRKDSRTSIAKDAETVPMGRETISDLIELFQSRGLNVIDLVVLSGAHTIGKASCGSIQDRLYGLNGTKPAIHDKYLDYLRRKCGYSSENGYVDLDGITPTKFDAQYYANLEKNMGLLSTDQMLYHDSRTSPIVKTLLQDRPLLLKDQPILAKPGHSIFKQQFAVSMVKLGNIQVLTDSHQGEIRTNCNFVNSY